MIKFELLREVKGMTKDELKEKKRSFLKDEFFYLSWNAATQHIKTWNKEAENFTTNKGKFIDELKEVIFKIMKEYEDKKNNEEEIEEENHHKRIKKIFDFTNNKDYKEIFNNEEGLTYAQAQKILNMMCKYYWCAGWMKKEPPEMPIDSINLGKLNNAERKQLKVDLKVLGKDIKGAISWTKDITDEDSYDKFIEVFKNHAENDNKQTIAQWELKNWLRRSSDKLSETD